MTTLQPVFGFQLYPLSQQPITPRFIQNPVAQKQQMIPTMASVVAPLSSAATVTTNSIAQSPDYTSLFRRASSSHTLKELFVFACIQLFFSGASKGFWFLSPYYMATTKAMSFYYALRMWGYLLRRKQLTPEMIEAEFFSDYAIFAVCAFIFFTESLQVLWKMYQNNSLSPPVS